MLQPFPVGKTFRLAVVAVLASMLVACGQEKPLRLGFVGGISGRVADLGIGGRNGATLAVEQRNAAGGVNGRQVELIVEDDQQDPEIARRAVARLLDRQVEAIVGPMTSAMAVAIVPQINRAQVLMMSPTVTATALAGLDDHFMRVVAATTEYARKSATHHFAVQGSRKVAVALDLRNKAYTESWLNDYRSAFVAAGGRIAEVVPFTSSDEIGFVGIAEGLLRARPDSVLILANSVDTALLAQQLRKRDQGVRINGAEWAATERLIELGGKAIEGMVVAQFINRESRQPSYLAFHKAYVGRFGQEPGFAGLTAFDAANVLLDGLAGRAPGQTLRQTILARREFAGAQSPIRFDTSGDAQRETYLTTIANGDFVRLHAAP